MIAFLRGLIHKEADRLVTVEVGGVGFFVNVLPETAMALGRANGPITLRTHLAVREDALELFGFLTAPEVDLFRHLISVSGIGPRAAMAILALAPPQALARAIGSGDVNYLTKVSGIGRKKAEKIILELKDKLSGTTEREVIVGDAGDADLLDALQALGWNLAEAREIIRGLPAELMGTKERLREALKRRES